MTNLTNQPDNMIRYQSLTYWANWIETGNMHLSAADAKERGEPYNVLHTDQMRLIVRLRDMANAELNHKPAIASKPQPAKRKMPPLPPPGPAKRASKAANSTVEEALALCDEIEAMAGDVPEQGEEFAVSVSERAASIRETIEERCSVTDSQMAALVNMAAGLARWIRD